eukprot:SAG31_NODE_61_length_29286_cov_444.645973_10_plen_85_part_00
MQQKYKRERAFKVEMKKLQRMNQTAEVQERQAQLESSQQLLPNLDEELTCSTIVALLDKLIIQCGDGDHDLKVKLRGAKDALDA